ncbi:MAG: 16S rRNA (guanine(527)-N(7))-methyltransferase RsmG [bacterium]|jgi:16S rRNA (guanine527-N7)-methyltransferase|nr:16S rRNA (guanine(527)-N(7))-methyltransferase RsmG [bacterium]
MVQLQEILSNADIAISKDQVLLFQKYIDLIKSWNKRTNLVSRQDEARLVERHILESIAVLAAYQIQENSEIIDIGSGAGFPAIPIRIIRPDLNFLLVESKRLKALFLREVIARLNLDRVEIACERAENLENTSSYLKQFDYAFSRAVANLDIIYGWISRLIKPGGSLLFWKGGNIKNEIEALLLASPNLSINIKKMDARLVVAERDKKFVQIQTTKS